MRSVVAVSSVRPAIVIPVDPLPNSAVPNSSMPSLRLSVLIAESTAQINRLSPYPRNALEGRVFVKRTMVSIRLFGAWQTAIDSPTLSRSTPGPRWP